jgi:hypothetical protein
LPVLIQETEVASNARRIAVTVLKRRVCDVAMETAQQSRAESLRLELELSRVQNRITALRVASFRSLGDDAQLSTLVGWSDPFRSEYSDYAMLFN